MTTTALAVELEQCAGCRQPMRPRGTYVADYPGTRARSGPNECLPCAQRRRERGGSKQRRRTTDVCVDCHRPMRAKSARPAPGVVPHGAGGRCQACADTCRRQGRDPVTGKKDYHLTEAPVDDDVARAAARTVKHHARDAQDYADVLRVLGIERAAS